MQKNNSQHEYTDAHESSPEREGASVRHLDKDFAREYRQWRGDNSNPYGFFYKPDTDEYTYRDGVGFVAESPEFSEQCAIYNVNRLTGKILLFCFVINLLIPFVVPRILRSVFGVDIGIDDNSRTVYGSTAAVAVFKFVTEMIRYCLPLLIVSTAAKMPVKVMFPVKISNKPLFSVSIPAALLIAAGDTMLMFPLKSIFRGVGVSMESTFPVFSSTWGAVLSILMSAFIFPILNELFVHGAVMQLLRQFGDGYALVISSLIIAVNADDLRLGAYFFVFSAVIGYFTLRTGSIITALIMRVIVSLYFAAQALFRLAPSKTASLLNVGLLLFCLIFGMVFVVGFLIKNNHKVSLPLKATYLSNYEKILNFLTDPVIILWIACSLSYMVLTAPLAL